MSVGCARCSQVASTVATCGILLTVDFDDPESGVTFYTEHLYVCRDCARAAADGQLLEIEV